MELKKVEEMLKDHERRIAELEGSPTKIIEPKKKEGKKSITDILVEIKSEGFFDKPKTRKDILDKFEELGHIYGGNSLNNPLARALRSRIIGRKKINNAWHYVKR